MPMEPIKEAVKIAVETSGDSSLWRWGVGTIGAGLIGLWGHVTGRIKKLEEISTPLQVLREHILDENSKFDALFANHKDQSEKIAKIAESVARIEGVLSK